MYSAGVTGHDVTPFINFLTSTFISCSSLAKVKQKGNVNIFLRIIEVRKK